MLGGGVSGEKCTSAADGSRRSMNRVLKATHCVTVPSPREGIINGEHFRVVVPAATALVDAFVDECTGFDGSEAAVRVCRRAG